MSFMTMIENINEIQGNKGKFDSEKLFSFLYF